MIRSGDVVTIQRLAPDAILDSTNYSTLNLADVDDDPDAPDGAFGTWDGVGMTSCRTSFPTPPGAPLVGAGLQSFRVLIRRTGVAVGVDWSLQLWENGVQTSVLATGTLNVASTVVSGTWDAATLGTPDGSLVECRLQQTSGGVGTAIEVGAVAWLAAYNDDIIGGLGGGGFASALALRMGFRGVGFHGWRG